MSRADANAEQARLAAEYLDTIGQPKHSTAVRAALMSLTVSRNTNAVLYRDNMALRDRIRQLELEASV